MTDVEWAYIAGLIDGEGCFYIRKHNDGAKYGPCLQVRMTNKAVVSWLHREFGGGLHQELRSAPNENIWLWVVSAKPTLSALLPELLPYLRVKRLNAVVLLEFCQRFATPPYSKEQKEEMEKYCGLAHTLNAVGPGSAARKERLRSIIFKGTIYEVW